MPQANFPRPGAGKGPGDARHNANRRRRSWQAGVNPSPANHRSSLITWYVLATVLAVFTYFYGLDSDHAPKNGDEFVYAHITRVTAKSGHWLPLQSELRGMRNTKPPLIFWQGIASTRWGADWSR